MPELLHAGIAVITVGHRLCYVQDLMALDCIPDMIEAGVCCFKIEGRLKGPEYVAITTAAYRAAVDKAWADFALQPKKTGFTERACWRLRRTAPLSASSL